MAMPASAEPSSRSPRACRLSGARTAVSRAPEINASALWAVSELPALALRLVQDSSAWTKASRPVQAVSAGGSVTVSAGSSTTRFGLVSWPQIHSFLPAELAKMLVDESSEPVPAVVGPQLAGMPDAGRGWADGKRLGE